MAIICTEKGWLCLKMGCGFMKGIILEAAWPRSALRLSPSSVIRRPVASPRVQQMKVASLERYFIMVWGKGNKSSLPQQKSPPQWAESLGSLAWTALNETQATSALSISLFRALCWPYSSHAINQISTYWIVYQSKFVSPCLSPIHICFFHVHFSGSLPSLIIHIHCMWILFLNS